MGMNNTKARIWALDYSRIIAAYLVVLGHLLPLTGCVVKSFIYGFHISLFFLISGILYHTNGKVELRKYIYTILLPAFFFMLFVGLLLSVGSYYSVLGLKYTSLYSIEKPDSLFIAIISSCWFDLKSLMVGGMVTNGPCWFLFALFFIKIICSSL